MDFFYEHTELGEILALIFLALSSVYIPFVIKRLTKKSSLIAFNLISFVAWWIWIAVTSFGIYLLDPGIEIGIMLVWVYMAVFAIVVNGAIASKKLKESLNNDSKNNIKHNDSEDVGLYPTKKVILAASIAVILVEYALITILNRIGVSISSNIINNSNGSLSMTMLIVLILIACAILVKRFKIEKSNYRRLFTQLAGIVITLQIIFGAVIIPILFIKGVKQSIPNEKNAVTQNSLSSTKWTSFKTGSPLNYNIFYPTTWTLRYSQPETGDTTYSAFMSIPDDGVDQDYGSGVEIHCSDYYKNMDINSIADETLNKVQILKLATQNNINIAGDNAIKLIGTPGWVKDTAYTKQQTIILVQKQNRVCSVNFPPTGNPNLSKLFDEFVQKIVSST